MFFLEKEDLLSVSAPEGSFKPRMLSKHLLFTDLIVATQEAFISLRFC